MKRLGKVLPWSYRSNVAVFLILVAIMSGLSAMVLSSLISRSAILTEMLQSEQEYAMTLQQLDRETGLSTEELLSILERSNLETHFLKNGDPDTEALRGIIGESGIATLGTFNGIPTTCVITSTGIVFIQAAQQYNLYSSTLTRVMSVGIFFIAAFLLASLVGSKHISHPISELTDATRRISEGDFSVRVPEGDHGEVGELMHSFNHMTEALGRTSYVQKDFISSVSHEFKTPIASIKGYARLLSMPGLSEEDRNDYIRMIASESDRLSRLSNTMLRLTALEQQGKSAIEEHFRLDEQVRQVILRMQSVWQEKSIHWDLDLKEVHLISDSALLEQVWTNLIQNAVKFSDSQSTIHISVWETADAAFFEIRDHGIGMTEEDLQHIFDRFYQADRSRSSEGVGLGLSLVRRILDMLGGSVKVTSVLHEGSVFRISIPNMSRGGKE